MRKWRRTRRLNPYQPATDTGLLKILALVVAIILIVFSGALDCRFAFFPFGFCLQTQTAGGGCYDRARRRRGSA